MFGGRTSRNASRDAWVVECSVDRGLTRAPEALCATDGRRTVLFDGELYDRSELQQDLGALLSGDIPDANLVLAAVGHWGEHAFEHLKGTYTIVAWDDAERVLLAVRDPLGLQPLFRSETDRTFLLSNSLQALAGHPGVRPGVSAAAVAAVIARRQPNHEELAYRNIVRIPQGHVWRADAARTSIRRYYDPRMLSTDAPRSRFDIAELDAVLNRAVSRRVGHGGSAVYLSSGIDSFAVAAYAGSVERDRDRRLLALSLVVPGEEMVDGAAQQAAAAALELEQVLLPLTDGVLAASLKLAGEWPAPLLDAWLPGFLALNREAATRGATTILTGNGGDEWLMSPIFVADLLRTRRFRDALNVASTYRRTYGRSRARAGRDVLWGYGLRPLLAHSTRRPLEAYGGRLLRRRLRELLPAWFLPGRELQTTVFDRPTASPDIRYDSVYARAAGKTYDHPMQDAEMEELYEAGRRTGVRFAHPLFDVDVLRLRYCLRPQDLSPGGRPKGLIRSALESRSPGLTPPARQMRTPNVFVELLREEGRSILERLGPPTALGDLGVVEPRRFVQDFESFVGGRDQQHVSRFWDALVLESWLRTHA